MTPQRGDRGGCRAMRSCVYVCHMLGFTKKNLAPHTSGPSEGRAPVWGSEFTSKAAALQKGSSRYSCWVERNIAGSGD